MKYSEGKLRITGGSEIVHGIGTNFSRQVTPESMLTLSLIIGAWMIVKVVSDTELVLNKPITAINDAAVSELDYVISNDFTPTMMAPYPKRGDADHVELMKRSFNLFDEAVGAALG